MIESQILGIDNGAALIIFVMAVGFVAWMVKK